MPSTPKVGGFLFDTYMTKKENRAYEFFISKGWTPAQAAGIVQNLVAESGLSTSAHGDKNHVAEGHKGTTKGSHGIAQWNGDRLINLKEQYGDKWDDFENQLKFVQWEFENTHKGAARRLKETKTARDAARAVVHYYEIPKDKEGASKYRGQLAETFLKNREANPFYGLKMESSLSKGTRLIDKNGIPMTKFSNEQQPFIDYSAYNEEDTEEFLDNYLYGEDSSFEDYLDEGPDYRSREFSFNSEEENIEQEEQNMEDEQIIADIDQTNEDEFDYDFEAGFDKYIEELQAEKEQNRQLALGIFSDFDQNEAQANPYEVMKKGGEITKEEYISKLPKSVYDMAESFTIIDQDSYLDNAYEINKILKRLK